MNNPNENVSMALFCDFENVALGVRDTKHQKFDIRPVLERLLLKGSIVVKKAYCDWERYKEFKATMHEANFELIEIPHVRQSGKNSADIRLVVDALDFCYTKSHVNTFVILSGDSDFSPLVSKLRENNKKVIGVGVKQSTSDLLVANCDEFIFYDDLVREGQNKAETRRDNRGAHNAGQRRTPEEERRRKEELEIRRTKAVEMVVETFDALVAERGDSGKIWASVLKEALKRRRPDFNESYYGFRAFGNLLEEAQSRGFLEVGREENSSTYVYRGAAAVPSPASAPAPALQTQGQGQPAQDEPRAQTSRGTRGGRRGERSNRGPRQNAGQNGYESRVSGDPGAARQEDMNAAPAAATIPSPPDGASSLVQAPHPAEITDATDTNPVAPASSRTRSPARNTKSRRAAAADETDVKAATNDSAGEPETTSDAAPQPARARTRRTSKTATPRATAAAAASPAADPALAIETPAMSPATASPVDAPAKKTAKTSAPRTRRPRKTASTES